MYALFSETEKDIEDIMKALAKFIEDQARESKFSLDDTWKIKITQVRMPKSPEFDD